MRQVHRSLITTLLAVAVGAGLVALAFWSKERGEIEERAAESRRRPLALERSAVDRITITGDAAAVTLERQGTRWRITRPVVERADPGAVSGLLNAAEDLELTARFEDDDGAPDLAALQLDPPRVEIKLEGGASAATIHLGRRNSFDGRVYVHAGPSKATATLGMIEGPTAIALDKNLSALRERRLCPIDTTDITALRVRVAGGEDDAISFRALRGDGARPPKMVWDDPWRLETPVAIPADRDTIDELLRGLTTARFNQVISETPGEDLSSYGLDAPMLEVEIEVAAGAEGCGLRIGLFGDAASQSLSALRNGATAITDAPQTLALALRRDLFALEEKRVLSFDRDQVRKIKLVFPGERLAVIEREVEDGGADSWSILSPRPGAAKSWRVTSLLHALGALKATRFAATALAPQPAPATLAPFGLDNPTRSVTLYDATERELGALLVGAAEGELGYVMRRGADRIAAVDRAQLDELPSDLAELAETPPAVDAGH